MPAPTTAAWGRAERVIGGGSSGAGHRGPVIVVASESDAAGWCGGVSAGLRGGSRALGESEREITRIGAIGERSDELGAEVVPRRYPPEHPVVATDDLAAGDGAGDGLGASGIVGRCVG